MTKYFTNNFPILNLYKKPSPKSEIVTQMIFGDSFSIFGRKRNWLKIKIKEDGYKGFIPKINLNPYVKPTHKIHKLKAKVYRSPNKRSKINELPFGSKIKIYEKSSKFFRFNKGWIEKNDFKLLSFKDKDLFTRASYFKNIKYKWGGKTFDGIDCSALVQMYYLYNKLLKKEYQIQFFSISMSHKCLNFHQYLLL